MFMGIEPGRPANGGRWHWFRETVRSGRSRFARGQPYTLPDALAAVSNARVADRQTTTRDTATWQLMLMRAAATNFRMIGNERVRDVRRSYASSSSRGAIFKQPVEVARNVAG